MDEFKTPCSKLFSEISRIIEYSLSLKKKKKKKIKSYIFFIKDILNQVKQKYS